MASLRAKFRMLRGLLDGEKAMAGPVWLVVELTRRCNYTCLGCFFHSPEARRRPPAQAVPDLPPELVERICTDLPQVGTRELILVGGGEAFLHPKLLDYVPAFLRAGFRVELFTNATLIDGPVARRLVESGLDVLHLTFWAVNAEEHARWHPGTNPALHRQSLEALPLITAARSASANGSPRVILEFPLHRQNFANLEERVNLALNGRADAVAFAYFRDWGGECQELTLSPEDARSLEPGLAAARKRLERGAVRHNIDEYLARVRLGHQAWRDVPCYAGWYNSCVNADGTIVPCTHCRLPMGNLREASFAEIWNGPRYREFRRRTATGAGLASLGDACDCANCCLVRDNGRVHRVFKWFAPLARKARGGERGRPAAR